MYDLLKDLRIVEGSAFVAAPLGGMTLAQLGADVIRFDPIGGGLDYRRWPVTRTGTKPVLVGPEQGQTLHCHRFALSRRKRTGRFPDN